MWLTARGPQLQTPGTSQLLGRNRHFADARGYSEIGSSGGTEVLYQSPSPILLSRGS